MFVNSHAISVYFSLVAAPVLCRCGSHHSMECAMFVNSHAISVYFSLVAVPVLCDWHPQWSVHVCELTCYQCLFLSCCTPFSVIGTLNGVYKFVNSHAISVYFSLVAAPLFSVIGTCNKREIFLSCYTDRHVSSQLTCYQCLFLSCCSSRSL